MPKNKKEYPLGLLRAIEELIKVESPYYVIVDTEDLLYFKDKDQKSTFYYAIKTFEVTPEQKLIVNVEYKPANENVLEVRGRKLDLSKLSGSVHDWESILEGFDGVKIFDDPILKQYEDEFLADFEILDEDADYKSYDLKTQIYINEYLDACKEKLLEVKNSGNKIEVEALEKSIEELKDIQTTLPKKKVVEHLAKIWAKTRKLSLKLLQEVYDVAKKEFIKALIKGQIDFPH